jgi:hypothetical protein
LWTGEAQVPLEAATVQVRSGNTAGRLEPTAAPTERAWLAVDIAISSRADGDFVARVSFDDEPSWAACRADDPLSALEGAVMIARRRASERAGAERELG